jgi:predicted tellurium resistance membrane protein TerC
MGISWRDIILIGGGLFLIAKATLEIHAEVDAHESEAAVSTTAQAFALIIARLVAVDLVFSLDPIITAIGMAEDLEVMIAAVVIAMIVMYVAADRRRLHRRAPHHQDAGAGLPGADRGRAPG